MSFHLRKWHAPTLGEVVQSTRLHAFPMPGVGRTLCAITPVTDRPLALNT